MAKNKIENYHGDEAPDAYGAAPCPDCGCRHREEVGRCDDGRTMRVTRICRNCGRRFVTAY